MKRYETIVIIDPDLSKEAETPIFERLADLIPQYEGFLIETDDWGTKKLAYDIKKKSRGHYVRLDFCGDGALIQEMERFFRIDDKVLKFMTVLLDEDADLDAIKADLAEKAAAEEKPVVETTETPVEAEASTEDNEPTEEKKEE
jgi:small subunit ribosomal protein S6